MSLTATVDPTALDELFAPYDRTDAPGFAVGVALHGIPRYRRGFGMASIELPVPLAPTIRMRIGSTTKHFCVLAVMLLAEQGKLSIEDSPRQYLPELPSWATGITLRQLMSHTSGMRDSLDLLFHALGPGVSVASDFQLELLSSLKSVNFAPGADWSYNNGGYVLLSEIVVRVSGRAFGEFLWTSIFEPVGMYDTLLREFDTELVANSATLHVPRPEGGYTRGSFGPPIRGEGGIVSTVDDMLKWLRHMASPTVGSAGTWRTMRTPVTTHGYGLGLFIGQHRGQRTIHHAGGVIGGASQMIKFVDQQLDIILMTNGRSVLDLYRLADCIADRCIPGLPPVAPDAGGTPPITGHFYSPATGRVISLFAHEGQQALLMGGMTLPALRAPDLSITVPILHSDLVIRPDDRHGLAPRTLEITEFGRHDRLERVDPPAEAPVADLVGEYSSEAGLTASISTTATGGAELRLHLGSGATPYRLAALAPALWQVTSMAPMPLGGTLEVNSLGFDLTTGRTARLHFRRRR